MTPAALSDSGSANTKRRRTFRSGWGDALFRWILAPVGAAMVRLLARSVRVEFEGREHYEAALRSGRPLVFAFWHEDLLGIAIGFLWTPPGRVAVMVSRSRDGERLSRVIHRLGLETVRASSSRGAVQGFIEMKRLMTGEERVSAALALDGPRGPRRRAKPGAALLARKTGALVLPVAFRHSHAKVFRSWDRTRLPLPFECCRLRMGAPIDAARWRDEDDEAHARELERVLNELEDAGGARDADGTGSAADAAR